MSETLRPHDDERIDLVSRMLAYGDYYMEKKFLEDFEEMQKLLRDEGCGCGSCMKNIVRNMNRWVDFLNLGGDDLFHYEIDWSKGKPRVVTPEEQIEQYLKPDYRDDDEAVGL